MSAELRLRLHAEQILALHDERRLQAHGQYDRNRLRYAAEAAVDCSLVDADLGSAIACDLDDALVLRGVLPPGVLWHHHDDVVAAAPPPGDGAPAAQWWLENEAERLLRTLSLVSDLHAPKKARLAVLALRSAAAVLDEQTLVPRLVGSLGAAGLVPEFDADAADGQWTAYLLTRGDAARETAAAAVAPPAQLSGVVGQFPHATVALRSDTRSNVAFRWVELRMTAPWPAVPLFANQRRAPSPSVRIETSAGTLHLSERGIPQEIGRDAPSSRWYLVDLRPALPTHGRGRVRVSLGACRVEAEFSW